MPPRLVKHLRITGRVQGVGYRDAMRQAAVDCAVTGWVRNRRDGSVEAMVRGDADALAAIIAWARNGPLLAQVVSVTVTDADGGEDNTFDAFEFRPTA